MHLLAQAVPLASHFPGGDVSVLSKTSMDGSGGLGVSWKKVKLDRFFLLNEDPRNTCRVELVYELVTDAVD